MDHSSSISRRARLRYLSVALLALGLADLVLRGWGGDARLLLLTLVVVVTFTIGWRLGAVSLAVSTIALAISSLVGRGVVVSAVSLPSPALPALLIGHGVFVVTGALVVLIGCALSSEASEQVDQARQTTRTLAKSVLDARIASLQSVNEGHLQHTRFLEASLSVAQHLATVFDVNTLLNRAAELVSEQFGFADVMIYTVDAGEEWATLQSASSLAGKEEVLRGLRLRRGSRGPIGWVLAQKQPQVLNQEERAAMESGIAADPDQRDVASTVTLPLLVQDQLVGILDVRTTMEAAAVRDELGSLVELANYLALTLNNAQRLGNETAVLEATSPVYRAANALATARTEQEVYDVFLSILGPYGPARALIIRAHGGDELAVVRDVVGSSVSREARDLSLLTPPGLIDVVILGLALDEPVCIPDLSSLDETLNPELSGALSNLIEEGAVGALAFAPIHMEGGATAGGLLLLYRTSHRFDQVERRLHQLLSELGGAALDRSQLLTEASARLNREEVLTSVGDRLRSSLDPDVIMRRAVQELARVLEADVATIEIAPGVDAGQAAVSTPAMSVYGDRDGVYPAERDA